MTDLVYTSSDSWTCPPGVKVINLALKGGGADAVGFNGGGGGARIDVTAMSVTPGTTYNFTIGSVGSATIWESVVFIAGGAAGSVGGIPSGTGTPTDSHTGGDGGAGATCDDGDHFGGGGSVAEHFSDGLDGDPATCEDGGGTNGASHNDGTSFGNGGPGGSGTGQPGWLQISYVPAYLDFTLTPAGGFVGGDMDFNVALKFSDDNTIDTSFTGNITIDFLYNHSGGVLTGTNPVAAVAGVASFTFSFDKASNVYQLRAVASDASDGGSTPFPVCDSLNFRVIAANVRSLVTYGGTVAAVPLTRQVRLNTTSIAAGVSYPLKSLATQVQYVASFAYAPVSMSPMQVLPAQVAVGYEGYAGTLAMAPLQVLPSILREFADAGSEHTARPLSSVAAYSGVISIGIAMSPLVAEPVAMKMLAIGGANSTLRPAATQAALLYGSLSTDIQLSLQEISLEEFPVETIYDLNLQLEQQEILLDAYYIQPRATVINPTAKFAEVSRSSSSIIIFGSTLHEQFKFNPSASIYRRLGPSHIIHLGPAKPSFSTTESLFTLLTPFAELQPLEFLYEAPGGFLKIWNEIIIQSALIPDDEDTAEIVITNASNQSISSVPAATSLVAKRQF